MSEIKNFDLDEFIESKKECNNPLINVINFLQSMDIEFEIEIEEEEISLEDFQLDFSNDEGDEE